MAGKKQMKNEMREDKKTNQQKNQKIMKTKEIKWKEECVNADGDDDMMYT